MGKLHTQTNVPLTPSQLVHGGPDKKKKKKKDKKNSKEISMTQNDVMHQLGLSLHGKKKKKKDKKEKSMMEVANISSSQTQDNTENSKKKKKKKDRTEELVKTKQVAFSPIVQTLSPPNGKRRHDDDQPIKKIKKQKMAGDEDVSSFVTPITSKTISKTSTPLAQELPAKKKKKNKESDANPSSSTKDAGIESILTHKKSKQKHNEVKGTEKNKVEGLTSPPHSPSKKKKKEEDTVKSSSKKKDDDDDEEEEEGEDEIDGWPTKVSLEALDRLAQQVRSDDKRSYRVTLNKVDWGAVTVGSYTEDEVKTHVTHILSKLIVYKNLNTLVEEARDLVKSGKLITSKRPLGAFNHFMKDFTRDNKELINSTRGSQRFSLIAEEWKKLPESEREKYKTQYRKDAAEFKEKIECKTYTKPYQFWAKEQRIKGSAMSKTVQKQTFDQLPDTTRFRYIRESLIELMERHKEETDDVAVIVKKLKRFDGPTKDELQVYLDQRKLPKMPPKRVSHYYYNELVEEGKVSRSGQVTDAEIVSYYNKLSAPMKIKYRKLYLNMRQEYLDKFKAWEEQLNPGDEIHLARQLLFGGQLPSYLQINKTKAKHVNRVTKTKKLVDLFPNVCASEMSCPKFTNEPKKPPTTSFMLFKLKYAPTIESEFKDNKMEKFKACQEKWKTLDSEQKETFNKKWKELMNNYEQEIQSYVAGMSKKMRSVYLGFQRKPMYSLFHRDIFEEYPNEKYPVYQVTPSKGARPVMDKKQTTLDQHFRIKPKNSSESESDSSEGANKNLQGKFVGSKPKEDSSSSEDETDGIKGIHPLKTPKKSLNKTPVPDTHLTESFVRNSSKFQNSSSDDEDEEPVRSPKKSQANPPANSSEESSEDEGIGFEVKKNQGKGIAALSAWKMKRDDEDEEEDSSEDEEEEVQKPPTKVVGKATTSKEESSSDEESDDDAIPAWQRHSFIAANKQENSSSEETD